MIIFGDGHCIQTRGKGVAVWDLVNAMSYQTRKLLMFFSHLYGQYFFFVPFHVYPLPFIIVSVRALRPRVYLGFELFL